MAELEFNEDGSIIDEHLQTLFLEHITRHSPYVLVYIDTVLNLDGDHVVMNAGGGITSLPMVKAILRKAIEAIDESQAGEDVL